MWQDVLGRMGVTVETVDADHVRLRGEGGERVLRLHRVERALASSQLPQPPGEPALLSLPRATLRTVEDARRAGWEVVTDAGLISVAVGQSRLERVAAKVLATRRRSQPGPPPWATFTVVRRLLAIAPSTQVELALAAGVSQSKVSRVLGKLREAGLVDRVAGGWRSSDWDRLFDWWLARYPGPAGVTTYWYSLDDVGTQATRALDALALVPDADAIVSGDAAADQLAPWRRPEKLTIYARAATSLAEAGFVPVGSAAEATLAVCAAKDPGVWLPRPWILGGLPLADPLQVAHDVSEADAVDSGEAVDMLRDALRTRHAQAWKIAAQGRA